MSEIGLVKIYSGKVRDLYEIDDKRMLMVASDRLSAFDVILDAPIPGKGEILTQISNFWFKKLAHIMPNHFTGDTVYDVLPENEAKALEKRAVVAKKLTPAKWIPLCAVIWQAAVGKIIKKPARFAVFGCPKVCGKRNNYPK